MEDHERRANGRLDPVDRSMEALFGLIMVLTFTGSLSVWAAGRQEVREMLIGALGCNLAWGIIDAFFYLIGVLSERGRSIQRIRRLQASGDPHVIEEVFSEVVPEVTELMTPAERSSLRERIAKLPEPPRYAKLNGSDVKKAVGVFLWVFLITFPVALPFVFIHDAFIAMRVSNGIAVLLLFFIGQRLARHAGFKVWLTSLVTVLLGLILVALTIELGG